jgi:hypothetical protein
MGSDVCMIEVTPGSPWPAVLRKRGYRLRPEPDGQRILPTAVREEIVTPGSTQVKTVVHHAGIVATKRYSFKASF